MINYMIGAACTVLCLFLNFFLCCLCLEKTHGQMSNFYELLDISIYVNKFIWFIILALEYRWIRMETRALLQ